MKLVVILLCVIALPIIAPLTLGMFVAVGATVAFVVSAPFTLLRNIWAAKAEPADDRNRGMSIGARG